MEKLAWVPHFIILPEYMGVFLMKLIPFTEVRSCDQTQDLTVLNDSQYMQIKAQTGSISKRFDIFSKNIS